MYGLAIPAAGPDGVLLFDHTGGLLVLVATVAVCATVLFVSVLRSGFRRPPANHGPRHLVAVGGPA